MRLIHNYIIYLNDTILAVFDIAGREVKSIVNERQNTGVYEAQFSATEFGSSISSGVFFTN